MVRLQLLQKRLMLIEAFFFWFCFFVAELTFVGVKRLNEAFSGGLGNTAAVLSGATLASISGPSGDPAAGVIEQTSGRLSVRPGNETKEAAADENVGACVWASDQRDGASEQGVGIPRSGEGVEDADESFRVR